MLATLTTRISKPKAPEINQYAMKLLVGLIALLLPVLTHLLARIAGTPISSISESYWAGGWPQSIFVGCLFAIASFLTAYNGELRREMVLGKVAALAALCVALFPCDCDGEPQIIPGLHYAAAGVMFAVLAYFCIVFLERARRKGHPEAIRRARIYLLCACGIVLAILALIYNGVTGRLSDRWGDFVYWGETLGLVSFGVSWLTASHTVPFTNRHDEKFRPFADVIQHQPKAN
jgi:hypothetical protein